MPEDFQIAEQDIDNGQQQPDPIEKLYKGLVADGKYTKSFEEFKKKYSSKENIDFLYSGLSQDGDYTKSKDEFYKQYFPQTTQPVAEPSKKKGKARVSPLQTTTSQLPSGIEDNVNTLRPSATDVGMMGGSTPITESGTRYIKEERHKLKTKAIIRDVPKPKENEGAENKYATEVYASELSNAAIKIYADDHPDFAKQLKGAKIDINDPSLSKRINSGRAGQIIAEVLSDPHFQETIVNDRPDLIPALNKAHETLLTENTKYGINVVANEVSQAIQETGYNNFDPIFNFHGEKDKEFADLVAHNKLTPQKLEIWNKYIKDHQEDYLDRPSLFEGIASGIKDVGEGIKNTFTIFDKEQNIRDQWEKEASHVSANPKGFLKGIRDVGHATGFVMSLAAGGEVGAAAGAPAKISQALAIGTTMFGNEYKEAQALYPDSPVKAWARSVLTTGAYMTLSNIFPSSKINQLLEDAKPELTNISERLAAGEITKDAAINEAQTILQKTIKIGGAALKQNIKTSGEMTAITLGKQAMDAAFGMDDKTFEKIHPKGEALETFKQMFLSNLPIAGLAGYGEVKRKIGENKGIQETPEFTKSEQPGLSEHQQLLQDAIDNNKLGNENFVNGAKEAVKTPEQSEQFFKEAAQQLNASEGESKTARKMYGDFISDKALELFPNEKAPEISSGIDELLNKSKEQKNISVQTPEEVKQKEITPEVKSRKESVIKKAQAIPPENIKSANDHVLNYFVNGGKINSSAINEIFGSVSKSVEGEKRSRISLLKKDAPTVDELAHQLWENAGRPEDITTMDFKDAIEIAIKDHNSHGSMARELIGVHESVMNELTAEEAKHIDEISTKKIEKIVEDMPEEHQNQLTQLLKKYQDEHGFVDWERLEKDSNGFEPEILSLPTEVQNSLYGLIEKNIKAGQGEHSYTPSESVGEEKELKKEIEPPKEPPTGKLKTEQKPLDLNNKSILTRLYESENIKPEAKKAFEEKGLKYEPRSHDEARSNAKDIISEYGDKDAVALAESGKFNGDVNSMIFAEALDKTSELEKNAKTPEEKSQYAAQWADYAIRFDESARSQGRFISAIHDFYKKSPVGIQIVEKAKRDEAFKVWFESKEKPYKEVFDALKEEPQFKQFVEEKVQQQLKNERTTSRMKRRKNIESFFEKGKISGEGKMMSTIIPPQLWNGAVEVMKQAALAGESLVAVIEKGIQHIKDNHKEPFDEEAFRKEWSERLKDVDAGKAPKLSDQERILERFRKKMKGLSEKEKEEVIRRSFKELVENGALEYADFKKIVADVMGLGELTAEQKAKIESYVKDINAVDDFKKKVLADESKENLKQYHDIHRKAEKSATDLANVIYNKPQLVNRLGSIMQLNTLTGVSLIKNISYNYWWQLLGRFPKAAVLTAIDQAIYGTGKLFGKEYKPDFNIFKSQKGYFNKLGLGSKEAAIQLFTGVTNKDYFQKEIYSAQIKPFQSIRDLLAWKKGEKHLSMSQITDKLMQATIGMPAEVVARILNVGDKPFRFAAEGSTASTEAARLGLKGIEREVFMAFPKEKALQVFKKQGLPEEKAMEKAEVIERNIIREGEESVFQQKNIIDEGLKYLGKGLENLADGNKVMEAANGARKLMGKALMPFVKIPLNVAWHFYNLANPEIALGQAVMYATSAAYKRAKGIESARLDAIQAKKWLAHAAIGVGSLSLYSWFSQIGAVRGGDEKDETQKERLSEKTYEQQHSLNISKVMRALGGESTDDKEGDLHVDLSWYGALGSLMNVQANKMEGMTEEQRKEGLSYFDDLTKRLNLSAFESVEQGAFSGNVALLNAYMNGTTGYWNNLGIQLFNMGLNTVQPGTFAQWSRAQLPYDYKIKANDFMGQLENNVAARSGLFRTLTGKYPPAAVNIWGDKMERKTNTLQQMFGISKSNMDNFAQPLYEDYKKSSNLQLFPPATSNFIEKGGERVNLTAKQSLEYAELVGKSRKNLVAPFINNQATITVAENNSLKQKKYSELDDEQKAKYLQMLYQMGLENGQEKFFAVYPELEPGGKTKSEKNINRRASQINRQKAESIIK